MRKLTASCAALIPHLQTCSAHTSRGRIANTPLAGLLEKMLMRKNDLELAAGLVSSNQAALLETYRSTAGRKRSRSSISPRFACCGWPPWIWRSISPGAGSPGPRRAAEPGHSSDSGAVRGSSDVLRPPPEDNRRAQAAARRLPATAAPSEPNRLPLRSARDPLRGASTDASRPGTSTASPFPTRRWRIWS